MLPLQCRTGPSIQPRKRVVVCIFTGEVSGPSYKLAFAFPPPLEMGREQCPCARISSVCSPSFGCRRLTLIPCLMDGEMPVTVQLV